MSVDDNIDTVRRFYAAGASDDDAQRAAFVAPDAVWHVPGNNPVSGPYHGVEAITKDMAARMQPLEEWSIEPRHVMGNDDLVVAVVHLRGTRRGVSVNTHGAHVFRFNADGRIAEAWGFTEDQAKLDELLSA